MEQFVRFMICLGTIGLGVFLVAGCASSMSDVDSRTDRLMRERLEAIRGSDPPERQFGSPDRTRTANELSRQPPTVNPTAEEIEFQEIGDAHQVEDMLRTYTRAAAGLDLDVPPLNLTLDQALRVAQRSSPEYLRREEDYILAAIRLLIERHAWSPRLMHSLGADVSGEADDGEFQGALNVINDLRVTRRLQSGGQVEAAWIWRATQNLRNDVTGRYRQSSEVAVSASIPLLRGAGATAAESLIQAERDLVYAARDFEEFRRQFLVDITRDYLGLLQSQARISNQKRQLVSLRILAEQVSAFVDAGRSRPFELNLTQNQVLSARESLASLRDSYIVQLERFKIRLGIEPDRAVVIRSVAFDLSEPVVTLEDAARRSLEYRLDLQNRRDRVDDSRRDLANARNSMLPDLNFTSRVGVPTDPDAREGGLNFDPDDVNYAAGITFGLPLDREQERLRLRSAVISLEQAERDMVISEHTAIIESRAAARDIELARFRLQIAEQQVRINELRRQEQEIRRDETRPQDRVDTETDLLNARNARDAAQTALRIAVLQYLLTTGQLRVASEGQFQPLPGMRLEPVRLFPEIDDLEEWYLDPPVEPAEIEQGIDRP